MSQTFEEWEKSAFSGGLGGGKPIALISWHARDGEIAALTAERDTAVAGAYLDAADIGNKIIFENVQIVCPGGESSLGAEVKQAILFCTPADALRAIELREAKAVLHEHHEYCRVCSEAIGPECRRIAQLIATIARLEAESVKEQSRRGDDER